MIAEKRSNFAILRLQIFLKNVLFTFSDLNTAETAGVFSYASL